MGRTLMIKTVETQKSAKSVSDYILGLLAKVKNFKVVVSETDKPKSTFFEKLGGLPPDWEDGCISAENTNAKWGVEK